MSDAQAAPAPMARAPVEFPSEADLKSVLKQEPTFTRENSSKSKDGFDIKGVQAGCVTTLLGATVDGDTQSFEGMSIITEKTLPMFGVVGKNREPFLNACNRVEMTLKGTRTGAADDKNSKITMETSPILTFYDAEDPTKWAELDEATDRVTFHDGNELVRYNVLRGTSWEYPGVGYTAEQEEKEEKLKKDREELRRDFAEGTFAFAGNPEMATMSTGDLKFDPTITAEGVEHRFVAADAPQNVKDALSTLKDAAAENPDNIFGYLSTKFLDFVDGNPLLSKLFASAFSVLAGMIMGYVTKLIVAKYLRPSIPKARSSRVRRFLERMADWLPWIVGGVTVASLWYFIWVYPISAFATPASITALQIMESTSMLQNVVSALRFTWDWLNIVFITVSTSFAIPWLATKGANNETVQKIMQTIKSEEALSLQAEFLQELQKEDNTGKLREIALKLLDEDRTFFTQLITGKPATIFSALVESFVKGEADGVERARLFYFLLDKWGAAANVEPAWESEKELVTSQLVEAYIKQKQSDPKRQVTLVYLGLMMSQLTNEMLNALLGTAAWQSIPTNDDAQNHLPQFRKGGVSARQQAESIYREYRVQLLYKNKDEWFFKAPNDLLATVATTIRRKLEFLQFSDPPLHLAGKKLNGSLLGADSGLDWTVEFGKRSVRATVQAKGYGDGDERNPTNPEGAGVEKVGDVYKSESASDLLRITAKGEGAADAVLMKAARLHVENALLSLITVFQKGDYYFSLDNFVVDKKGEEAVAEAKAAAEAAEAARKEKAAADAKAAAIRVQQIQRGREGRRAAAAAQKQEAEKDAAAARFQARMRDLIAVEEVRTKADKARSEYSAAVAEVEEMFGPEEAEKLRLLGKADRDDRVEKEFDKLFELAKTYKQLFLQIPGIDLEAEEAEFKRADDRLKKSKADVIESYDKIEKILSTFKTTVDRFEALREPGQSDNTAEIRARKDDLKKVHDELTRSLEEAYANSIAAEPEKKQQLEQSRDAYVEMWKKAFDRAIVKYTELEEEAERREPLKAKALEDEELARAAEQRYEKATEEANIARETYRQNKTKENEDELDRAEKKEAEAALEARLARDRAIESAAKVATWWDAARLRAKQVVRALKKPAAPGPDLDALLADHAASMRRVRDLLETD